MKGAKYFFVATLLTFVCVDMSGAVDMCIQSWANNSITGYGMATTTSSGRTVKKVRWSAKISAQGSVSRDTMYGIGKCFRNFTNAPLNGISTQPSLYTAVDASSPYITQYRKIDGSYGSALINACWCKMYYPAVSKWVYVGVIEGTNTLADNCLTACGDRCAPSGTMATALKNAYWSSVSY